MPEYRVIRPLVQNLLDTPLTEHRTVQIDAPLSDAKLSMMATALIQSTKKEARA